MDKVRSIVLVGFVAPEGGTVPVLSEEDKYD